MEVLDLIKNRWSPRALKSDALTEGQMKVIIEAASCAFSAAHSQPWHFTYAHHGSEGFQQIVDALLPGNQPWAKNAAVLMISSAYTKDLSHAILDLGSANMNLALQAFSMDIYSHFMAGFDVEKAKMITQLGDDYRPMTIVALGYKDDPKVLDAPYKERETGVKQRKSVEAISTAL